MPGAGKESAAGFRELARPRSAPQPRAAAWLGLVVACPKESRWSLMEDWPLAAEQQGSILRRADAEVGDWPRDKTDPLLHRGKHALHLGITQVKRTPGRSGDAQWRTVLPNLYPCRLRLVMETWQVAGS
ncbi:hypothetical protein NDU88_005452 [Pleurodeles waltl]|uniref:Uncharacterized protein n=1 Tax=Pleurodeles waltl TaxID=8319 RepID=A0AAV7LL69_PLEWA|nr:hypothetical protein NDU88_005452 [Pleurodeles waltl]